MSAAEPITHAQTPPSALNPELSGDREARIERERRLGATLVRLGKLNNEALARINEIQRRTNAPFARTASRLGLITKEDVATALGVQNGFLREGEGEGRLPPNLVIVRRPASKEAEQFRALRTRILASKDCEKFKLIAIASIGASRAADHVAQNMAASFAQIGRRVLLVDADFRATRLASRFAAPQGPGLKEALAGACDVRNAVRPTVIANLSMIASGETTYAGYELLAAQTLRLTLEYLRCAFDNVIVMTTPFGPIADAQFVWAAAGNAFAVLRRHADRRTELEALNKAIRQVDAAVVGAVLS